MEILPQITQEYYDRVRKVAESAAYASLVRHLQSGVVIQYGEVDGQITVGARATEEAEMISVFSGVDISPDAIAEFYLEIQREKGITCFWGAEELARAVRKADELGLIFRNKSGLLLPLHSLPYSRIA